MVSAFFGASAFNTDQLIADHLDSDRAFDFTALPVDVDFPGTDRILQAEKIVVITVVCDLCDCFIGFGNQWGYVGQDYRIKNGSVR